MPTNFTAGVTTTTGNNAVALDNSTWQQVGTRFTMSEAGSVQSLSVYASGGTSNVCRMILVLWDSSGNILLQSSQFNAAPASGTGVNQQSWQTQSVGPLTILAGTYYVGFWRNQNDYVEYSVNNSTGTSALTHQGIGFNNPKFLGANFVTEQLSAYVTYWKAGGIEVWNGSTWNRNPMYSWNGSAWVRNPVYEWNGSAWIHNA